VLIVFTVFCFLVDEKIILKVLACFYLLILTIFPVTRSKDPEAAILTLKINTYRKPPVFL
jgi:hypothetical protein